MASALRSASITNRLCCALRQFGRTATSASLISPLERPYTTAGGRLLGSRTVCMRAGNARGVWGYALPGKFCKLDALRVLLRPRLAQSGTTVIVICASSYVVRWVQTSERGVRHGASRRTRFRNPLDFTWISDFRLDSCISRGFLDFKVDFWISKRISGFQSEFLDNFQSGFWILFEELLFVILKMLLMNNDVFSAQIHTEYNVTSTS